LVLQRARCIDDVATKIDSVRDDTEETMRKIIIGLAAAASVAALTLPTLSTDASARGWGHHRGGWHGGGGWRGGWGWRGYYGYPSYAYYPGYSCWRSVRAWGPYGWYWRRVWVCG
jgi:hypothetical protein